MYALQFSEVGICRNILDMRDPVLPDIAHLPYNYSSSIINLAANFALKQLTDSPISLFHFYLPE